MSVCVWLCLACLFPLPATLTHRQPCGKDSWQPRLQLRSFAQQACVLSTINSFMTCLTWCCVYLESWLSRPSRCLPPSLAPPIELHPTVTIGAELHLPTHQPREGDDRQTSYSSPRCRLVFTANGLAMPKKSAHGRVGYCRC